MSSLPGYTPTYDANGNVLGDSLHSYAWDAEGHAVTIDTVGATYDALGRMVEQNRSGTYTEIAYAPTGVKLALMSGQTLQKAFVPLPAGATAVYTSSGIAYYRHPDWLGSSRLASTPSRGIYSDAAYGPFGEPYAQSGTTDLSFTGQSQDTVSALYDFPARAYGIQGRWPSPDPAGFASAHWRDPQSLNRYAYALNDPMALIDRLGMDGDCSGGCPELDGGDGGGDAGGGDSSGIEDSGNGQGQGQGCDPNDPACGGGSGSGDEQSCNVLTDPTCGGRVNVDPCVNPESASCAHPEVYAQGYGPWGIMGADDPCYTPDGKGGAAAVPSAKNKSDCDKAGGTWVPPGWTYNVNGDGSITPVQPPSTTRDNVCAGMVIVGTYGFTIGTMAQFGVVSAPVGWVAWGIAGVAAAGAWLCF